ncbi:hypothetical protein M9H77_03752 [Catharanthus roseus]|uniref:Uncharacterized protein n=1 Tax=Catharanthus roseus TaxID=4058 RepID=A0ACC0CCA5_CATRO|nr:hypothetical protein M9H77_03752 [Catharanthus roseus]
MSQSPTEVKNGPITRAERRKLTGLEDNGIVAYLEEALKCKLEGFEGKERASKLFSMCSISKDQRREQIGGEITQVPREIRCIFEGSHRIANGSPAPAIAGRLLLAPSLEDVKVPCLPIVIVFNLISVRLE